LRPPSWPWWAAAGRLSSSWWWCCPSLSSSLPAVKLHVELYFIRARNRADYIPIRNYMENGKLGYLHETANLGRTTQNLSNNKNYWRPTDFVSSDRILIFLVNGPLKGAGCVLTFGFLWGVGVYLGLTIDQSFSPNLARDGRQVCRPGRAELRLKDWAHFSTKTTRFGSAVEW
jgi:hypothetical protein